MNYKRIISSNSNKSASSSGKSVPHSGEISELNSEIESLKQVIETLKSSIESRDTAIGTLAREKEKVFVELKSAQRTIRGLRQQLSDERTIFIKEKEYLAEEIERLSRNDNLEVRSQRPSSKVLEQKIIVEKEEIIDSLKGQLLEKDQVICKLCAKYLKLKNDKSHLQSKFQQLKTEFQETRRITMCYLEENKQIMDKTFRKMFKSSAVSSHSKKYLELLNQNFKLSTENAQLKLSVATNIRMKDESEANLHEDDLVHEIYSTVAAPPPEQTQKFPQKSSLSEEDYQFGWKPHRDDKTRYKWHRNKLNKSNYWLSTALLGSLYRKSKSLSAQLLQESRRKSTSMPCLSLI